MPSSPKTSWSFATSTRASSIPIGASRSSRQPRCAKPLLADPKKCDYRYFFDHLEDEESEVADDALREFVRADYRDVFPLAKDWPADRLTGWLKGIKKPENATDKYWARLRLYAILLGDCGTEVHAKLLRDLLESSDGKYSYEGLLIGYTLLKPREGTTLLREQFQAPKTELSIRLSALQAARFLLDFRTNRVDRGQLLDAIACMLEHTDVADLAIEELRRRGYREKTERILRVFDEDDLVPVQKRAVVRYALSCPKDPRAVKFLLRVRRLDGGPALVDEVAETLQFEQTGSQKQ
jgi:hypothetical protein